jgi:hypothetical protein
VRTFSSSTARRLGRLVLGILAAPLRLKQRCNPHTQQDANQRPSELACQPADHETEQAKEPFHIATLMFPSVGGGGDYASSRDERVACKPGK